MGSIRASLARRGARERTFRGLKPTAKVSRRYRGEDLLQTASAPSMGQRGMTSAVEIGGEHDRRDHARVFSFTLTGDIERGAVID